MPQYLITTPLNPEYNEHTFYVRFDKGRALLNEHTLPRRAGFNETVESLAAKFRLMKGYDVRELPDRPGGPTAEDLGIFTGLPVAASADSPVFEPSVEAPATIPPSQAEQVLERRLARKAKG